MFRGSGTGLALRVARILSHGRCSVCFTALPVYEHGRYDCDQGQASQSPNNTTRNSTHVVT